MSSLADKSNRTSKTLDMSSAAELDQFCADTALKLPTTLTQGSDTDSVAKRQRSCNELDEAITAIMDESFPSFQNNNMPHTSPDKPGPDASDNIDSASTHTPKEVENTLKGEMSISQPQQATTPGCFLVENYNDVLSYMLGVFSGVIFAKDYVPGKLIPVLLLVPAIVIMSTFVFGYNTKFPGPTRLIIIEAVVALCGLLVAFLQHAQNPLQRSDCKMISIMAAWMANENLWVFVFGIALAVGCLVLLPLQLPMRRQNIIESEQKAKTETEMVIQVVPNHDPKSYKSFIMMLKAASYIALATAIFVLTPVFQTDLKIAMIEELPFLVISAVCGIVLPLGLTSMLHKIIELQQNVKHVRDHQTQQEDEFVDALDHPVKLKANDDLSDTLIELALTTVFDVAMLYCLFTVPDFTKNQKIILGYGMVIASIPVSWYSKMVSWRKTSPQRIGSFKKSAAGHVAPESKKKVA